MTNVSNVSPCLTKNVSSHLTPGSLDPGEVRRDTATHHTKGTQMNDFPVLDTDRSTIPGGEGTKTELADLGMIEPYVDEMDWWCRLPVRVTHGYVSGVCIELGPPRQRGLCHPSAVGLRYATGDVAA